MPNEKNTKIKKYRRPVYINAGMIVFFIIFIYIIITLIHALTKPDISVTEVEKGRIVDSSLYTGIIIRDEEVVSAPASGYINYYIHDGEKAAKDENVCMIDTEGAYTAGTKDNSSIAFTPQDYSEIRNIISLYSNAYSNSKFSDIYAFKYNMQNKITEIISSQSIDNAQAGLGAVHNMTAPESGIITYAYDNMETLTKDDIQDSMFNYADYESHQITSSEKVEAGAPAFKLTKSNIWSIIIKLTPAQAASFEEMTASNPYISLKFVKDDISTTASVTLFSNGESTYARLEMPRYMVRYITDRYIDIEVISREASGLKIPASAVVEKDFYKIPASYLITDSNTNEEGFYRYTKGSDGQLAPDFVKPTIYQNDGEFCYVDLSEFTLGDYIGDGTSQDNLYRIGATGTLTGVYNINQGYAVFRLVNIKYRNDDYCIVSENTAYGVALYDHIVLNASSVDEDEIIYY